MDNLRLTSLADLEAAWRDDEETHRRIYESCYAATNDTPELARHRDYIEANNYGFGERGFHWLWKLIVDTLPMNFRFLEIGVHRGQVLSLVTLLAAMRRNPYPQVVGVSTFDGRNAGENKDYQRDVLNLFAYFQQTPPVLIVGDSTFPLTIAAASAYRPFDVVYIDGSHEEDDVKSDITHYGEMVRVGGYLVCDDSANRFSLPWGYFRGHEAVSRAVDSLLPPGTPSANWRHLGNVAHNRIWKRIASEPVIG